MEAQEVPTVVRHREVTEETGGLTLPRATLAMLEAAGLRVDPEARHPHVSRAGVVVLAESAAVEQQGASVVVAIQARVVPRLVELGYRQAARVA